MIAFQARSMTRARPPARCSQKIHRPPGSPDRKLPTPLANSNANRNRIATLTARAFIEGSLRYLAVKEGTHNVPQQGLLQDTSEQRLDTLTSDLCQEEGSPSPSHCKPL